jgi:hypothetical protein
LLLVLSGRGSALRARSSVLTMPARGLTDEDKRQRKEGALTVLRDAGADDFSTARELYDRIAEAPNFTSWRPAKDSLSAALKALPPRHELRQKFEAIKARSSSSSGRSAAMRLGQSGTGYAGLKSLVQARQERTAYAAARSGLPTTQATGLRLLREFNVATKATAASIKDVMGARVECACISGILEGVDDFETAVGVAGSVRAVSVAPNGFCYVRKDLVKDGGQRADAFVDEQAAAFRKEDANERAYEAALAPAATVTKFPHRSVMASAIQAADIDLPPGLPRRLGDAGDAVLRPLYVQALAVQAERKSSRPSRDAKKAGDDARHAKARDAYAGDGAVLRPPVALAREPGHFARARHAVAEDGRDEDIQKIADGLELQHKFRCPARVVMMPHRSSDEYGR